MQRRAHELRHDTTAALLRRGRLGCCWRRSDCHGSSAAASSELHFRPGCRRWWSGGDRQMGISEAFPQRHRCAVAHCYGSRGHHHGWSSTASNRLRLLCNAAVVTTRSARRACILLLRVVVGGAGAVKKNNLFNRNASLSYILHTIRGRSAACIESEW